MFTVPPGGDGVYYLTTYLLLQAGEFTTFDMRLNDDIICLANPDHDSVGSDSPSGSCSTAVNVVTGNLDFRYFIQFEIFLVLWS